MTPETPILIGVANHLWQSTLCLGLAALLVRSLKAHSARWRYRIWLAASVKFLVPFALLSGLGARLPQPAHASGPTVSVSIAMQTIGEPFQAGGDSLAAGGSIFSALEALLPTMQHVVVSVWLAGAALLLAGHLIRRCRMTRLIRASTPLDDGREYEALERGRRAVGLRVPIGLLTSDSWLEPAVAGTMRPSILWPAGLTPRLTDRELDAIFAHELLHVRRRDNLVAATHGLVARVFWFHPLVWWLHGRLLEERERACDEAVLTLGNPPHTYALGILKVGNFCLRSPLATMAGVTGANLTQRVEDIMSARTALSLGAGRTMLLALTGAALVLGPVAAGSLQARAIALPFLPEAATSAAASLLPEPVAVPQGSIGHVSGTVTDQRGDPIAGVEITAAISPAEAPGAGAFRAETDESGRFSLDVPPAQYELRAQKIGFTASRTTVFVNRGATVQRTLQLRVGAVSESINVVATSDLERAKALLQQGRYSDAEAAVDRALARLQGRSQGRGGPPNQNVTMPQAERQPLPPGTVRVGGEIAAPKKIHDVAPIYPQTARDSKVGGIVIIDAIIGTDGTVKDAKILRGQALLNQAALDAVSQWAFTPTLLNGAPVEVMMTVTVNFQLQ